MPNHLDTFSSFSFSKQNPLLFVIVLVVIALHLLLLGLGTFWHPAQPTPKPRSKVAVQTVRLKPIQSETTQGKTSIPAALPIPSVTPAVPLPIEQPKVVPPASQLVKEDPLPSPVTSNPVTQKEEAPPTLKPAPQETPKKNTKQTAPVKKSSEPAKKANNNDSVKSKQAEQAEKKRQQEQAEKKRQQELAEKKRQQEIAAAQEAARQKEQALLAKAKENLAKMSETRDKINTSSSVNLESTNLPKEIVSLHVDALPLGGSEGSGEWGTKETSYKDEIAYRLKMALKLPDYGAVKIKLTLSRTGKVVKIEIVKSESNKNKAYVENKIPTLLFPSFGQKFQGEPHYTFEFLLQNDS